MPDETPRRCPGCGHVKLPQEELCYACRIMAEGKQRRSLLADAPPAALVELVEGETAGRAWRQWRVLRCPHCGKRHHHGAGGPQDDPRRFLGHRIAHCVLNAGPRPSYVLVESTKHEERTGSWL